MNYTKSRLTNKRILKRQSTKNMVYYYLNESINSNSVKDYIFKTNHVFFHGRLLYIII